ncbi:hypothetical protein ACA910_014812 [Epithemia clementina (nom. ined.)]
MEAKRKSQDSSHQHHDQHHHHAQIIVQHNYHDRSHDHPPPTSPTFQTLLSAAPDAASSSSSDSSSLLPTQLHHYDWSLRTTSTTPFPLKLYEMLDQIDRHEDESNIVSWQPHGRCFVIHNAQQFRDALLPRYFPKLSKVTSFQRQLNLYGFQRITQGLDKGSYYHECFLRGKPYLAYEIQRIKVKGTGVRGKSNPEQEPDFWVMEWVGTSKITSSAEVIAPTTTSAATITDLAVPATGMERDDEEQQQEDDEYDDMAVASPPALVSSSSSVFSSFSSPQRPQEQESFNSSSYAMDNVSVVSNEEDAQQPLGQPSSSTSEHLVLPMDMETTTVPLETAAVAESSKSWLFSPTDVVLTEWGMPFHALDALPDDMVATRTQTPPPSPDQEDDEDSLNSHHKFLGDLDDQLYMEQVLSHMVLEEEGLAHSKGEEMGHDAQQDDDQDLAGLWEAIAAV